MAGPGAGPMAAGAARFVIAMIHHPQRQTRSRRIAPAQVDRLKPTVGHRPRRRQRPATAGAGRPDSAGVPRAPGTPGFGRSPALPVVCPVCGPVSPRPVPPRPNRQSTRQSVRGMRPVPKVPDCSAGANCSPVPGSTGPALPSSRPATGPTAPATPLHPGHPGRRGLIGAGCVRSGAWRSIRGFGYSVPCLPLEGTSKNLGFLVD